MRVSDWHILPILETSLQVFLVQSTGSVPGKYFLKRACPALTLNFSLETAFGNNKQKQKKANTWIEL